jgi:hypothetical protein
MILEWDALEPGGSSSFWPVAGVDMVCYAGQ